MPANPQFPEIRRTAKCSEHFRHDTASVLRQRGRFMDHVIDRLNIEGAPLAVREGRSTLKGHGSSRLPGPLTGR